MHDLLNKRETALRLRISERTLDRLVANGTGPATTRIGSRVLFRTDQLGEWIADCQPRSEAATPISSAA